MTYQEKQHEADMEVRVFKLKIQVQVWLLQAEGGVRVWKATVIIVFKKFK